MAQAYAPSSRAPTRATVAPQFARGSWITDAAGWTYPVVGTAGTPAYQDAAGWVSVAEATAPTGATALRTSIQNETVGVY